MKIEKWNFSSESGLEPGIFTWTKFSMFSKYFLKSSFPNSLHFTNFKEHFSTFKQNSYSMISRF